VKIHFVWHFRVVFIYNKSTYTLTLIYTYTLTYTHSPTHSCLVGIFATLDADAKKGFSMMLAFKASIHVAVKQLLELQVGE
jgi:hypothetical protein